MGRGGKRRARNSRGPLHSRPLSPYRFSLYSQRSLGTRKKGPWGHKIFELIRMFFGLAVWNKEFLNGSKKRNDSLIHPFETTWLHAWTREVLESMTENSVSQSPSFFVQSHRRLREMKRVWGREWACSICCFAALTSHARKRKRLLAVYSRLDFTWVPVF